MRSQRRSDVLEQNDLWLVYGSECYLDCDCSANFTAATLNTPKKVQLYGEVAVDFVFQGNAITTEPKLSETRNLYPRHHHSTAKYKMLNMNPFNPLGRRRFGKGLNLLYLAMNIYNACFIDSYKVYKSWLLILSIVCHLKSLPEPFQPSLQLAQRLAVPKPCPSCDYNPSKL